MQNLPNGKQNLRARLKTLRSQYVSRLCVTPYMLLLISTLIYFMPYFSGSFEYVLPTGKHMIHAYSDRVGQAVFFIIALILLAIAAVPSRRVEFRIGPSNNFEAMALIILIITLGAYVILSGNIFIVNKQEMLEETGRLDLVFYQTCTIAFIFSILAGLRRYWVIFAASLAGLLLIVYSGHRSSLAIAIIGVLYVLFRNRKVSWKLLLILPASITFYFLLSIYKAIYVAVKLGNWSLVAKRLAPENLASSSLVGMEQFVTFAHLDFVVNSDFRLACSNIWTIPVSVIPFMDSLLEKTFDIHGCYYNTQVQSIFFSGYSGGVAANIWAEFFGYFGYMGFPVLILVLTFFFWGIEQLIRRVRSPVLISGLIVSLINMSFYIQRKELAGAFVSAKRAFIVALIVFLLAMLLRQIASGRLPRFRSAGWPAPVRPCSES